MNSLNKLNIEIWYAKIPMNLVTVYQGRDCKRLEPEEEGWITLLMDKMVELFLESDRKVLLIATNLVSASIKLSTHRKISRANELSLSKQSPLTRIESFSIRKVVNLVKVTISLRSPPTILIYL